jgi:hypothetical protein
VARGSGWDRPTTNEGFVRLNLKTDVEADDATGFRVVLVPGSE